MILGLLILVAVNGLIGLSLYFLEWPEWDE
jgi:hypothetical protein